MRRIVASALLLLASGAAQAASDLELFEADQRLGRAGFIAGAASPVLLAGGILISEEAPTAGLVVGGIGMVSAAGLPLMGRRSMLAAKHLGSGSGKGAVSLFFSIGTLLSGTYFLALDPNAGVGTAYFVCSAGALGFGGWQLSDNRFVATMRTDPRRGELWLTPTPSGLALSGRW